MNVFTTSVPSGYTFNGFSNCTGSSDSNSCSFLMPNSDVMLNANFVSSAITLTTTASPSSAGSVIRSPDYTNYPYGTSVMLTASPLSGHTFLGWSGDCSGVAKCWLTMNSSKTATATFSP